MIRSDVVLVFAFGEPASIPPNVMIARAALRYARLDGGVPIFTQRDVYVGETDVITARQGKDEYLTTPAIISQFLEAARRENWRVVRVLAAPPHEWRVVRDLKVMARKRGLCLTVLADDLGRFQSGDVPRSGWFSGASTQKHTRDAFNWWRREIPVRLLPFFIYERLTRRPAI